MKNFKIVLMALTMACGAMGIVEASAPAPVQLDGIVSQVGECCICGDEDVPVIVSVGEGGCHDAVCPDNLLSHYLSRYTDPEEDGPVYRQEGFNKCPVCRKPIKKEVLQALNNWLKNTVPGRQRLAEVMQRAKIAAPGGIYVPHDRLYTVEECYADIVAAPLVPGAAVQRPVAMPAPPMPAAAAVQRPVGEDDYDVQLAAVLAASKRERDEKYAARARQEEEELEQALQLSRLRVSASGGSGAGVGYTPARVATPAGARWTCGRDECGYQNNPNTNSICGQCGGFRDELTPGAAPVPVAASAWPVPAPVARPPVAVSTPQLRATEGKWQCINLLCPPNRPTAEWCLTCNKQKPFSLSATPWECKIEWCGGKNVANVRNCSTCGLAYNPRTAQPLAAEPAGYWAGVGSSLPTAARGYGTGVGSFLPKPQPLKWVCQVCTMNNKSEDLKCDACYNPKPK